MNAIGIMQGRLSPTPAGRPQAFPKASWRDEFARAAACGLDCIEWLITADGIADNPIWSDPGVSEIHALAAASGVRVATVCADCFIAHPVVNDPQLLDRVVRRSAAVGAGVVVVPIIEAAAVRTRDELVAVLQAIAPVALTAATLHVRIGLESDLPGPLLRELLEASGLPAVGVCYDVGNATARGGHPAADIAALGPRLCAVHIKDRRRGGASTPLGEGDADFAAFVAALEVHGFSGPLILETPAGADPEAQAIRHRRFMHDLLAGRRAVAR
jgi:L-ribulose-5-phosphate 3-epimerase